MKASAASRAAHAAEAQLLSQDHSATTVGATPLQLSSITQSMFEKKSLNEEHETWTRHLNQAPKT